MTRGLKTSAVREAALITGIVVVGLYVGGSVLVDGFSVPGPVVVLGLVSGLSYGLLAVGLVLVYRTSGVINFAHGEVGTLAASLFGIWVADSATGGFGLPYWLLFPAAMAVGAGANVAVEVAAVRRLRAAPRVMSLVVTLGAGSFFALVALAVNTKIRSGSQYPRPPGLPTIQVGALTITPEYTALLVATPLLVGALALFLSRSRLGIALRAAADNRESALMSAIAADRMSSLAWALAGAASAFVAVLQFPQKGFVIGGAALGPALLVRSLLAVVVARLRSLPIALVFGVVVGVIEQVSLWNTSSGGPTEILLFAILVVVLLAQNKEAGRARNPENWSAARPWSRVPDAWLGLRRVQLLSPTLMAVAVATFVGVGLSSNRVALAFTLVIAYAMVGLSVFVVTGMSGELSLGQFAVAGVGALVSVHVVDDVVRSVPVGILAGGLAGTVISTLIGVPALRIRGLMLAVTTLSFAVAAEAWLFPQSWAIGAGVQPPRIVLIDQPVTSARGYFLFALPFLAGALWLVHNLSTSGFGRALRGLRDNEDGARAFGVPATRRKLQAFAFAGFLAGAGGAIYAHGLPRLGFDTFAADHSVTVVAVTLIGGLSLMIGPLLGALYLLALPALIELDEVGLAVSTFGWLILLLYFPGGLAQAVKPLRDRILAAMARSAAPKGVHPELDVAAEIATAAASVRAVGTPARIAVTRDRLGLVDEPLLELSGLSKSFGGVQAVDGVTLAVHTGETVGIIGPNGAGKTTLFELIGGFTEPDTGTVRFCGLDVTDLAPEGRARRGLVRSFQDARLFPTLTVRETLQLASERVAPSGFWPSLSGWPTALIGERRMAQQADELLSTMGLTSYAHTPIGELSTGTRRITELAALVAMRPRLVLLDEPSSGVAQRETEALGALLGRLKTVLDTTFVIIEHDMPLLLEISDRLVAMETGRVIATGAPDTVVHHPEVVASYLGTDRRALGRSGAGAGPTARRSNGQQTPDRPRAQRTRAGGGAA